MNMTRQPITIHRADFLYAIVRLLEEFTPAYILLYSPSTGLLFTAPREDPGLGYVDLLRLSTIKKLLAQLKADHEPDSPIAQEIAAWLRRTYVECLWDLEKEASAKLRKEGYDVIWEGRL